MPFVNCQCKICGYRFHYCKKCNKNFELDFNDEDFCSEKCYGKYKKTTMKQ